jgi:hypothetical protein
MSRVLWVTALLLGCSTFAAAVANVSTPWDVWYYHLPFAARIVGLVPEQAYRFHATNQARYDGFPLLAELLQGMLWKLTGRPESANLVAFGALALFVGYLYRAHRVPPHLAVVSLFAVPLVQLHATSCYVDLPAGLATAALLLETIGLYASRKRREPWWFLLLAGIAVNMRFQVHVVVSVAMLAAAPPIMGPVLRDLGRVNALRALAKVGLVTALLPFVLYTPLKNLIFHQNPYFPMRLTLFGKLFPGVESTYSSSPLYLDRAPRAVRFVYSLLELNIRPIGDEHRWTPDQWAPWDSPALRMGGFFGAYVVFHLTLLAWMAVQDAARPVRVYAVAFVLVTAMTAVLPQSHELRYYLFWMILLVSINLVLLMRSRARFAASVHGVGSLIALSVVLLSTRTAYVAPWGPTLRALVRAKVDAAVPARLHEGERVCLARDPWTFLYASAFHGSVRYSVRETEHAEDCGDYRWIP